MCCCGPPPLLPPRSPPLLLHPIKLTRFLNLTLHLSVPHANPTAKINAESFFIFQFSILCCDNTVFNQVWVRFWSGKDHVFFWFGATKASKNPPNISFEISALVATNTAGISPGMSFKISSFGATMKAAERASGPWSDPASGLVDVVTNSGLLLGSCCSTTAI